MTVQRKKESRSGIEIKPENKGKFTAWCKRQGFGGVTQECIRKGLKSDDPGVRRMANVARNARKWGD